MLDSLGSTLTQTAVGVFFICYGKKPHENRLTYAETMQCLENELGKPKSKKRQMGAIRAMSGTPYVVTESETWEGGGTEYGGDGESRLAYHPYRTPSPKLDCKKSAFRHVTPRVQCLSRFNQSCVPAQDPLVDPKLQRRAGDGRPS
jgi:hypothetical protein